MSPFDDIDKKRILEDTQYFRGSVTAQLEHMHDCFHRLEKKIDAAVLRTDTLEKFQIKTTAIASVLATAGAFILNTIIGISVK